MRVQFSKMEPAMLEETDRRIKVLRIEERMLSGSLI